MLRAVKRCNFSNKTDRRSVYLAYLYQVPRARNVSTLREHRFEAFNSTPFGHRFREHVKHHQKKLNRQNFLLILLTCVDGVNIDPI